MVFYSFVFFWVIAIFIYLNEYRTKCDTWAALMWFLYGFGGLSVVLRQQADIGNIGWVFPAVAACIGMLWGPYTLLMFSLHFTDKISKDNRKQILITVMTALPIIVYCFLAPTLEVLGHIASQQVQALHVRIITMLVAPYYLGTTILLTRNLLKNSNMGRRTKSHTTFLIIVPPALTYYVFAYILPCFNISYGWEVSFFIMLIVCVLFIYFVVTGNVFGLSFQHQNIPQEHMEQAVIEGTSILQRAMEEDLLAIEIALQNAEYQYTKEQKDMVEVMENIQSAMNSCDDTLSVLDKVRCQMHPDNLKLQICSICPILDQVIEQCQNEYADKKVQIVKKTESEPELYCDPVHIREVLKNVLNNAYEAMDNDGTGILVIVVRESRKHVTIQIRDNGCGIGKHQLNRIGIPFLTTKDEKLHSGLGLYYVKKIIDMHRGEFYLKKIAAGGMQAEITLPKFKR